jgi:hypothetical protein
MTLLLHAPDTGKGLVAAKARCPHCRQLVGLACAGGVLRLAAHAMPNGGACPASGKE